MALVLGASGCAQLQLPAVKWTWWKAPSERRAEIVMEPASGSRDVDPRAGIRVRADSAEVTLKRVEVRDGDGKLLPGQVQSTAYVVRASLQFGTHYRISALAASSSGEPIHREFELTTVAVPKLEGGLVRAISPDHTVTLAFDRPVGRLAVNGALTAKVDADAARRSFRVAVDGYTKGGTTPVQVSWETPGGVPLPPIALELTSATPLTIETNVNGQNNLGLALPAELRFSEPLAERDRVPDLLRVQTAEGTAVQGRWRWIAEQKLRFTPEPQWPALNAIEIRAEAGKIRSARGGVNPESLISRFETGPDRRIIVYLDTQRLAAIENGQVVRTIRVSTGKAATPTVTGSYYIYARYPRKTMRSEAKPGEPGHYVVENVPYAQYFHADYALHGAWWHNGFGRPASHGCVNIPTRTNNRRWPKAPEEAGWLYDWAALGTPVTVQRQASR